MKNTNSTTLDCILNYATEYFYQHGYDIELECIHTFEAGETPTTKHYCCELWKGSKYEFNQNQQ